MSMRWIARQLLLYPAVRSSRSLRRGTYNPRPAGVIQPGSTTDLTLQWLAQRPGRWFTHRQIVTGVGRTEKTVSWSLFYLRSLRRIESTARGGSGINSRYLRYRAAPSGHLSGEPRPGEAG